MMPSARVSSSVGVRPTLYFGDCAASVTAPASSTAAARPPDQVLRLKPDDTYVASAYVVSAFRLR